MYLSIDIGTSGIKAAVVNETGDMLFHAYRSLTVHAAQDNKRELDPVQVQEKSFEAMREVLCKYKSGKIRLITIAALGEAAVPISRDGKALARSIVGSDPRGAKELEQLCKALGEERIVQITGVNLSYIYTLNKILYLKTHLPKMHEKVWKYLCFTDYIGYLLTGETKIDYSMASRTMAFDINNNSWSREILQAAGLHQELFSQPVPGGTIIGNLLKSAGKELGLPYDVPVMAGSHDHIYNALGSGVVSSGSCSNAVGTTEGFTAVLNTRLEGGMISKNQISCEPFVAEGLYNTVAWHNTAGAMVNWFVDTFYKDSGQRKAQILNSLDNGITSVPSSLMVLPHFAGSTVRYMDEKAKGAVIGLTAATSREEVFKAVLEGACYECRMIADQITDAAIPLEKLVVSGGGSKSPLWMQLKANILGRVIYKSAVTDTGAAGGAVLGAVALGDYPDLKEAARQMIKVPEMIEPESKYFQQYQERFEEYTELYSKLKNINHKL